MPISAKDFLDQIINKHRVSAVRVREVYILLNLSTLILFVAIFNLYGSILHTQKNVIESSGATTANFAPNAPKYDKISNDSISINQIDAEATGRRFSFLNIPIIGVSIYAFDIPVWGAICMSILMTWFFFTVRSENQILQEFHRLVKKYYDEVKNNLNVKFKQRSSRKLKYLFQGIKYNMVFATDTEDDTPYLDDKDKKAYFLRLGHSLLLLFPIIVLTAVGLHIYLGALLYANESIVSVRIQEYGSWRKWAHLTLFGILFFYCIYSLVKTFALIRANTEMLRDGKVRYLSLFPVKNTPNNFNPSIVGGNLPNSDGGGGPLNSGSGGAITNNTGAVNADSSVTTHSQLTSPADEESSLTIPTHIPEPKANDPNKSNEIKIQAGIMVKAEGVERIVEKAIDWLSSPFKNKRFR